MPQSGDASAQRARRVASGLLIVAPGLPEPVVAGGQDAEILDRLLQRRAAGRVVQENEWGIGRMLGLDLLVEIKPLGRISFHLCGLAPLINLRVDVVGPDGA